MQRAVPPIEARDVIIDKTSAASGCERTHVDPVQRRRVVAAQHAGCKTRVPEIAGGDQDAFVDALRDGARVFERVEMRVPGSRTTRLWPFTGARLEARGLPGCRDHGPMDRWGR